MKKVSLYSFTHFIIDLCCAFLMFDVMWSSKDWILFLLVYNFFAFAMQMPLGFIADIWNRNSICAALGCGLVAIAYGLTDMELVAVVVLGLGNALFHIGGGIEVLNLSTNKAKYLGIFVAPGAFGLYLGTLLGTSHATIKLLLVCILVIMGLVILSVTYDKASRFQTGNELSSYHHKSISEKIHQWGCIGCFTIVVILRSYLGCAASFPWKSEGYFVIALIALVVSGKIAGGFLSDQIGLKKAAVVSMLLATICYIFSDIWFFGLLATFLFNMSMPMTLYAMGRLLPGLKGFGFGLLTFGLFLGYLPEYFHWNIPMNNGFGYAAVCLMSLVFLYFGFRKMVMA